MSMSGADGEFQIVWSGRGGGGVSNEFGGGCCSPRNTSAVRQGNGKGGLLRGQGQMTAGATINCGGMEGLGNVCCQEDVSTAQNLSQPLPHPLPPYLGHARGVQKGRETLVQRVRCSSGAVYWMYFWGLWQRQQWIGFRDSPIVRPVLTIFLTVRITMAAALASKPAVQGT